VQNENSVYIGDKPTMNYVLACLTLFHSGFRNVIIKARGMNTSKAIVTAELVRTKFSNKICIKDIKTGIETVKGKNGKVRNIGVITIILSMEKEGMDV
jgi:DNA-binding protein